MELINQDAFKARWNGDFMPLATNGNVYSDQVTGSAESVNAGSGYWTGHYTTRPLMKGLVARADGAKHTAEIALSLSCALSNKRNDTLCGSQPDVDLMLSREVTSVLQHHDNIPGTSAPDAAVNLDVRLRASLRSSDAVMRKATGAPQASETVETNDVSGISRVLTKPGESIVFFNPTAATRQEFVEFELAHGSDSAGSFLFYESLTGKQAESVTIPPIPQPPGAVRDSSFVHNSTIVLNVSIPPLSYKAYNTVAASSLSSPVPMPVENWSCHMVGSLASDVSIGQETVSVSFSAKTGRIVAATADGEKFNLSQQFSSYHATSGSDAYQFHPDRSQFPFGEPLEAGTADVKNTNSSQTRMQLCSIKTPLVERVSQIYLSGPPPPNPPPPPPNPQDGIDCSTKEKCRKTCPHMSTCSDGVYYCCGTHGEHMQQCSAVHACTSNPSLHDCACGSMRQHVLPAGTVLVVESVSIYSGSVAVETKSEFTMRTMDREMVTRYKTNIDNTVKESYWPQGGEGTVSGNLPVFETDSNGMLMMTRTTNKTHWGKNESYFHVSAAIAGNYFPLASPGAIRIKSQQQQRQSRGRFGNGGDGGSSSDSRAFAIVTDRAHGASSLKKGWVEVMLGRRVAEGGGISVDDTDHLTQINWLFLGASSANVAERQRLQQNRVAAPLASLVLSPTDAARLIAMQPAPPTGSLPLNIHLQSLDRVGLEYTPEPEAERTVLRLRHVFQEGEGPMAEKATVDLSTLLPQGLHIADVVELPLNGVGRGVPIPDTTKLTLNPMQTRTFEVALQRSAPVKSQMKS